MSEWLKGIIVYMLIVSITMQMIPEQKYEQYIKLFTGLLFLIFVFRPVLKIGSLDTYLENKISGFVQEQEYLEKQIGKESEIFSWQSTDYEVQKQWMVEIPEIQEVEVVIHD